MSEHSTRRSTSTAAAIAALDLPGAPTADPAWRLVEEGFALPREHEIESLFTVANGYVGTRGSLAEGCSLSWPATFVAGVFDVGPDAGAGPTLVRLPDWTHLALVVGGLRLTLEAGEIVEHRRVLDLRQAILWREWRQRDPTGRVTHLRFLRLASLADRHLLAQSVLITPENYSDTVHIESRLQWPADPGGGTVERAASGDGAPDVLLRTTSRGVVVAVALGGEMRTGRGERVERAREPGPRGVVERWTWYAGIGETALLTRLAIVYTSRDDENPAGAAARHLARARDDGIERAVDAHVTAWSARWSVADVRVAGDEPDQRALRFAAYHLISAANPEDEGVSIGARALTGEAYKGHVFWDTEIYLLPFYTLTDPPAARALLMYRYHTLPAARAKASALGYRGALYAWESADTGEDVTPSSAVAPDGQIVPILTGEQEHHVSADVAYAVWHYWRATGDDRFLLDAGAEILLETARFWASRGRLEPDGRYHFRCVIGPDEYHECVDDNAYTNLMARWNLERGADAARLVADRWPERWRALAERLGLSPEEPEAWRHVAAAIETGFDPGTGLFEQFRGFFDLEDVDLAAHGPCAVPIDVCLGRERTRRSRVIKQADVVALGVLLRDCFPREVHEANFRYYEPRTAHGSSLSSAFHALAAARLGDTALAERYFRQTAEIDLADRMGSAAGGVHIGALGGLWQAAVLGVAGLRLGEDGLAFDPHLLPAWHGLSFVTRWRGRTVSVSVTREPRGIEVAMEGEGPMTAALVGGPSRTIAPGHRYQARRLDGAWEAWREVDG
ncbi:MAG TPA: glycosyl hydrolase family 65 protein [Thermodesulfobacteriota bacterium]